MSNITSVTVCFGNGLKREEYGPVKKAEVSITASVADDEDGEAVLTDVGRLAMLKVAEMLSAPKPEVADKPAEAPAAGESQAPVRRRRTAKKDEATEDTPESKPEDTPSESTTTPQSEPEAEDEWAAGPEDTPVSDQEILSATSKRAGELGARDPIVKLIASFATRTEGAPFKVQEIPQAQRRDYLAKLAALTA